MAKKSNEIIALSGTFGRMPAPEEIDKLVEQYASAIGRLVWAWNHLQEEMATLFAALTPVGYEGSMLGAWHVTESDRTQRMMLRDAALRALPTVLSSPQKADIEWLVTEVGKLAEARNNAIHAPLLIAVSADTGTGVVPHSLHGNPRAQKLVAGKKDLMHEMVLCKETSNVLRQYALKMMFCLRSAGQQPWPERPTMPNRGTRKNLGDRHHRIRP